MREFDSEIVDHLNSQCTGEPIVFIGLGSYHFAISFAGVARLQTMTKAVFSIGGVMHTWEDGPSDAPVWRLIGQTPIRFELATPLALVMRLDSGDAVEFHTDLQPYESALVDFGETDGALILDIF